MKGYTKFIIVTTGLKERSQKIDSRSKKEEHSAIYSDSTQVKKVGEGSFPQSNHFPTRTNE